MSDVYAKVRGYTVELAEERSSSSRFKTWVTAGSMLIALGAIAGSVVAYNRPIAPPVVVMVDQITGTTTILDGVSPTKLTWGQAIDESNVRRYVQMRERYLDAITVDDFRTVAAMSTPELQQEYRVGLVDRERAIGDGQVDAEIRSIVLSENGTAEVWFGTVEKRGATTQVERRWLVKLRYSYINAAMTPETRARNPLGFQVRSYMKYDNTGGAL